MTRAHLYHAGGRWRVRWTGRDGERMVQVLHVNDLPAKWPMDATAEEAVAYFRASWPQICITMEAPGCVYARPPEMRKRYYG